MPRRLAALILAFLCAGCLTPAQQEAIRVQHEINRAIAVADTCLAPLRDKWDYQALYARLAIEPTIPPPEPTPAQMADPGRPDRAAVAVMVALHGELSVCRAPLIESIARIAPALAETAVDIWLRGDAMVLTLMRGRITWGEANRGIATLRDEYFQRLAEVIAETRRSIDATAAGAAVASEAPPRPVPDSVRRFPQDLADLQREMLAVLAAMPPR
ncbi:hypothetical protein [Neoroseomonas oryzicola]|uniref:Uncharacterized protein n=1 Tax=Neoroseomonas oryzicola TaxID=535904 RepID=A0A9X9WL51_9PROT|nr:hypothetical protein [Neoroseomonas oryzicola]MBR0661061.1 hypothetical protein [Neoroseomonas oryzicola]NKE18290.1 hypothetical protein [Neoroseomonas oryzicola]